MQLSETVAKKIKDIADKMAEAHPDMPRKPSPRELSVKTTDLAGEAKDPVLDDTPGRAMGLGISRQRTVMEAPTPGLQATKEDIKPIFEDLFNS